MLFRSKMYSVEELSKTFHEIKILNIIYKDAYGGALGLPGLKLGASLLALACISVGIRLGTRLNPILLVLLLFGALCCVCLLGLVMPLSAAVHERTSNFSFPNFQESSYRSRPAFSRNLISSFKPYAIQIADLYDIRRGTTLTFMSLFLSSLINILLTMSLYSVVD